MPALHQSRTHINLAKRRADAAIRIFENRGSLLAAGNAQSDLRRAAEQFWRGPRSAFVRAQELRGKQCESGPACAQRRRAATVGPLGCSQPSAFDARAHTLHIPMLRPRAVLVAGWARYAFRVLDSPHYWIARLLRLGIYCVCYVASTYFMRARNDDGVWCAARRLDAQGARAWQRAEGSGRGGGGGWLAGWMRGSHPFLTPSCLCSSAHIALLRTPRARTAALPAGSSRRCRSPST